MDTMMPNNDDQTAQTSGQASAGHGSGSKDSFVYEEAFSRNIGWVTHAEQQRLRQARVAIAGMGGVGGQHLLTLSRLGIGGFHIADFDVFELANFNRQAGATINTLGRSKVDVMAEAARGINPEMELAAFGEGIGADNVDRFLEGVDLYVDSLDFFAVAARRLIFAKCAEKGIAALTAAPLGMGVAFLAFVPGAGSMTFEEYFQLEGHDEPEQLLRFLVGLAPAGLHRKYLVDPSTIDLVNHRGPSTSIAIDLCAAVTAGQTLKLLLGRGDVPTAPTVLQFDAYRNRFVRSRRAGGNRHPLQRLTLWIARRKILGQLNEPR
jgi:molybdopterin/thiamine biosynthesis adenylyltransferase